MREVAIATSSADKSGIGEEFGERDRLAVGQLGELDTAGETVCQYDGVGVGGDGR